MIAAEWYTSRARYWAGEHDREMAAAAVLSRLRLLTFGGFAVFAGLAWHFAGRPSSTALAAAAAGCLLVFLFLVRQHARVLDRADRADAGRRLSAIGLARLGRQWHALPDIDPPSDLDLDTHPYARDLDLFGHASLTKWLGRTATGDGARRLWDWLLAPAAAAEVQARQAAAGELAERREWREALAIEGALTALSDTDLARFLEWAETPESAVPAVMKVVAPLLPLTLAVLLVPYLAGAMETPWWLLPLALNVTLSFVFAPRVFAAFDRVALGQRALTRYGAMLALVCDHEWTSPLLARLRAAMREGDPAPAAVGKIATLAAWSELRTGAAMLHFPVQALTMWDFHILFAAERWRRRSGVRVRAWIDALATMDALAALALIRADEPGWALPAVDPAAGSFTATALGHPLIAPDRRVTNDVTVGPPGSMLLVTGSNMSGKSTLLRAVGLNAVLAQAGAPVCAAALTLPEVALHTSIRVQDSLELGLSYFMAALARLKQIVDAAGRHAAAAADGGGRPFGKLLYLLDEVLQGTNSIERGVAVCAVAQHLLDAGAIGAMTTHDLALAGEEPLRSSAVLVHFSEQVHADGTMTFDYHLRPGLATSTNALRLMQAIGITPR